jgi:hypothetical protein
VGEQNRRAVDLEPAPGEGRPARRPRRVAPDGGAEEAPGRALSPEADERQTARQAPDGAAPGESAENDSVG